MEQIIQSLWVGEKLSKLEKLSIKSFLDNGHKYHLYTYDKVEGVPEGVEIKNGNDILDKSEIFRYKNGSISAFSNLFRFVLLYKKGGYWVDTDLICVKKLPFKENDLILVSEPFKDYDKSTPTSSLLKIPKNHIIGLMGIKILREFKKAILDGRMGWGAGPTTVKLLVNNYNLTKNILPWNTICSCCWDDYKSIFYPNEKEFNKNVIKNIKDIPNNMYCIHLWNEMLRQGGIDKNGTFDKESLFEQLKKKHNIIN